MTKLQQMPHGAACYFHADGSANSVPLQKSNKIRVFCTCHGAIFPAIDAVAAEFSGPQCSPDASQRPCRALQIRSPSLF
jgi:hypothetical protein